MLLHSNISHIYVHSTIKTIYFQQSHKTKTSVSALQRPDKVCSLTAMLMHQCNRNFTISSISPAKLKVLIITEKKNNEVSEFVTKLAIKNMFFRIKWTFTTEHRGHYFL